MRILRRMMMLMAVIGVGVSCEKRPQPVDSGADDAKLRPEVAVARGKASPTFAETRVSPTPSP